MAISHPFSMAVEAVGQKTTVAAIASADGHICATLRFPRGASYHTTQREQLRPLIHDAISHLLKQVGLRYDESDKCRLCIGLTGVTFPFDRNFGMISLLERIHFKGSSIAFCTGDAEISFVGQTQSLLGSGILCHSGSTAFAADGRSFLRFGGWGPAIGDDGSAFWMGRQVLGAIGQAHDRGVNAEDSILWNEVRHWLANPLLDDDDLMKGAIQWKRYSDRVVRKQCDERTAVFLFIHRLIRSDHFSSRRAIVCHLVRPLMAAWAKGDEQASRIVTEAAQLLIHQYDGACRRAQIDESSGPVILYGGVFKYHQAFADLVEKMLIARQPERQPMIVKQSSPTALRPVCGGLLLALGGSQGETYRLPSSEIISTIRTSAKKYADLADY